MSITNENVCTQYAIEVTTLDSTYYFYDHYGTPSIHRYIDKICLFCSFLEAKEYLFVNKKAFIELFKYQTIVKIKLHGYDIVDSKFSEILNWDSLINKEY